MLTAVPWPHLTGESGVVATGLGFLWGKAKNGESAVGNLTG
jgi:hypothetical protein